MGMNCIVNELKQFEKNSKKINNPLITIILPIYNGEKYIERCLASIAQQTFTDYELLVIDNASIDSTFSICKKWICDHDLNVKYYFISQKGVSLARNIGLANAKGKFITFVDADDWLADNFLEILYKNISCYDADISICGYDVIYENCDNNHDRDLYDNPKMISYEEVFSGIFRSSHIGGFVWNKLFRKDCINDVKFEQDVEICEDMIFFWDVVCNRSKIVYQNKICYHYQMIENSVTHKIDNAFDKNKNLKFAVAMERLKKRNDFTLDEESIINSRIFLVTVATKLNYSLISNKDGEIVNKLNKLLRMYVKDFVYDKNYNKSKKIYTILTSIFWRLRPIVRKVKR